MSESPVVVVGAGPVGLAATLALRARGLDVVVLEAEPADRQRPGSRAIYTHGATLRALERIVPGLGRQLADAGLVWPTRRTTYRGRDVFVRTYEGGPPAAKLPHFSSLPQVEIERQLMDAVKADGVEIVWDAPVTAVTSGDDGVTLTTGDGRAWRAEYVVGADGARSAVRAAVGAELEGSRSAHTYVIADVANDAEHPLPCERVFHYEHPAVGGRNVLLVPFAGGWRADLQLEEGDNPADFADGAGLRRWVGATLAPSYADRVTWVSTYQFLQVVASSFTDEHRRVLLVGEAAHLFAPFGARGWNSGVADVEAAVRAIVTARTARHPALARNDVERFARERRGAAESNRAAAGAALAHLTAATPVNRARRGLAARASRWVGAAGEWLDTAPYGPREPASRSSKY